MQKLVTDICLSCSNCIPMEIIWSVC